MFETALDLESGDQLRRNHFRKKLMLLSLEDEPKTDQGLDPDLNKYR